MRRLLRQLWSDLTYQVLALPASILAFTVVVGVLSLAAAAIGIIIGLPFLLVLFAAVRWNARLERKRAGWTLEEPIGEAYRRREGNWLRRLRVVSGDPQSWKDLAWLTFAGIFGFAASIVTITLWATIAGVLVLPAWYWSLPENGPDFGLFRADTLGEAFLSVDLALVAIPIAYVLTRWMTAGTLRLSKALLSPSREAALEARVGELAPSTRRPPSCSASSATCTTARRRGSSRSRSISAWPRSASPATPMARASSSARRARRPSARSRSCATSPAACGRACSPSAASARR
jgi:hypothetical protein